MFSLQNFLWNVKASATSSMKMTKVIISSQLASRKVATLTQQLPQRLVLRPWFVLIFSSYHSITAGFGTNLWVVPVSVATSLGIMTLFRHQRIHKRCKKHIFEFYIMHQALSEFLLKSNPRPPRDTPPKEGNLILITSEF